MKPQARIQALIELLDKIQNSRIPMDGTCGDYFRVRRYIGAKDRAFVAETIYEIVRHTARLGWWLDQVKAEDTPRNRVITFMALVQHTEFKRFKDLFDGSNHAPEELTDSERGLIENLSGKDLMDKSMPPAIRAECPALYQDKLEAYFGDDFEAEMAAMLKRATLDLRVNTYLAPLEKAMAFLEADGVKTAKTNYSPVGLRCDNKAYLSRTKAFGKGWIEIQDEGSQLIAMQCNAQPGMQVLDFCAGAGGKTLALAAAMQKKGRIVAMDNDERRLMKGRDRYRKAGLADIIEVRGLEDEKNRKWLRRQKGTFDIVLLDVPCTGTGTWRRNPDMRWRTYGPNLEELTTIQAEILDRAAPCVKDGGRLVYATCSLLPDENEAQIEAFMKRNDGFEILPIENAALGNPFMRLTPHRHSTDGFFAAVLVKKSASE
jgi:16S rRNA (cytosine967-C5)-methyltransferase